MTELSSVIFDYRLRLWWDIVNPPIDYEPAEVLSYNSSKFASADTIYSTCRGECIHSNGLAVGCHEECVRLLPTGFVDKLVPISQRSFQPAPPQEKARTTWLRKDLAKNLAVTLPFPFDVTLGIAWYLPQQHATNLLTTLDYWMPHSTRVNVSIPFTEKHVIFEMQRYVSSVMNTNKMCLSQPRISPVLVYVCEDHNGITQLIISETEEPPAIDPVPGKWWKSLRLSKFDHEIEFHSDGFKLRRVCYQDTSTDEITAWPTPQPPRDFRFQQFCYPNFYPESYHTPARMASLSYNLPGVTGISVYCRPEPSAFYAHRVGDDLSLYKSKANNAAWIYMPLDADEFISEIWMRGIRRSTTKLALAFVTNKQRVTLAGHVVFFAEYTYAWTLLDVSHGEPKQLFYDTHIDGIRCLMFDSPAPLALSQPFSGPLSDYLSPKLARTTNHHLFWSSAPLAGVVTVEHCRVKVERSWEITGLLFCYKDEPTKALGQVRLDCLTGARTVDPTQQLWFQFRLNKGQRPVVIRVEVTKPPNPDVTWFSVPWSDTLEWWFSFRETHLWHDGRKSLSREWKSTNAAEE
ncbi:hypothetical protein S7711_08458 [Stachybotrys chartarum IBT 7711]|uniref:Uncharacterized protein n=1 Tax=Stachybotrys chartarum (strain CBS 109288 / IBT 7711) TaxID=1280523 RepID=A0A084AGG9_STACB|nr:hypothetical protein S7711_08458 [Stachybotrys chartarum IBT 7711]